MFFSKKKPEIKKKTKGELVREYIAKAFFLTLGCFIVAVGLELFLLPNKIIDGGRKDVKKNTIFDSGSYHDTFM